MIAVVGSLNVDFTLRVPRIPAPGETLIASERLTCFGGKGANQAVAAARAGGRVKMIGCVGDDEHGRRYREHLSREGIDHGGVLISEAGTGCAFITVDDEGENSIVVHPGANNELSVARVESLANHFEGVEVVLLQLECPPAAVMRAAELARAAGAKVILNPSPWQDDLVGIGMNCDVLIVNESEARALTAAEEACPAELSYERIPASLIVTRGANPTLVTGSGEAFESCPPVVTPVDTVGAGDTFAGVFAVAYGEGRALLDSVRMANAAAALATLQAGAQEAIPTRAEIEATLA